jgi:Double sensory domain of two-component sensor kinase
MLGLRLQLIVVLVVSMIIAFGLLLLGVNASLRGGTTQIATAQVLAGANALQAALADRAEEIRSSVLQSSGQEQVINALSVRNAPALREIANDLAESAGVSFVVVTDSSGKIIAGNRTSSTATLTDALVTSASQGSMIGGLVHMPAAEVQLVGGPGGANGALALVTASPVNSGGRTLGVLYAGEYVDPQMKSVAAVSKVTGGATAIVLQGQIVDTSLDGKDGFPLVGLAVPDLASVQARQVFTGPQMLNGTEYFVAMQPLADVNGNIVGAAWFGVPNATFTGIVSHTLLIIAMWGIAGVVIGVAFAIVVAERIGRTIIRRSREVNESAKELSVLVVGGEVSGDHVVQTREKLETIERLAGQISQEPSAPTEATQLRKLATEAVGDVIVIDTLTGEMSTRMRDAVSRVAQLSEVARALNELVAGTRPSRN